jgi:hypothetical protein
VNELKDIALKLDIPITLENGKSLTKTSLYNNIVIKIEKLT